MTTTRTTAPGPPRPKDPKRELAVVLGRFIGIVLVLVAAALIAHYCGFEPDVHFKVADRVVAVDGDTLRSGDTEVRLYGIDAPELYQTCAGPDGKEWACGREAQLRLKSLIGRYAVDCEPRARDKFNRQVAVCRTSKVPDLGEAMVREGFAINLGGGDRGEGPYVDAEIEAQAAKHGIWRGDFERPSEWRQEHPREAE
jgi:endonuclease YncB( thermonuclease family)